ncbi:MAG: hypothetical protein WC942_10295 [Clostridia bacterium]|jgi:hypothetical protein|nr:hypothetical protein [Clostridia bacterium]
MKFIKIENQWKKYNGTVNKKITVTNVFGKEEILNTKPLKFVKVNDWSNLDWTDTILFSNKYKSGLLAPNGKFYGCAYFCHDIQALMVHKKDITELEKEGWCRLTYLVNREDLQVEFCFRKSKNLPTIQQIDYIKNLEGKHEEFFFELRQAIHQRSIEKLNETNKAIKENEDSLYKKIKLLSLDILKYPDIEIQCHIVKDMKVFVEKFLEIQAQKNIFPKIINDTALIQARLGVVGEEVDTRRRVEKNGNIYIIDEKKENVKIEGSMIVSSLNGQEHIVEPQIFKEKYTPTNKNGVYTHFFESIKCIELMHDIFFKTNAGEKICVLKGTTLNITSLDNPYPMQNVAFEKSYTNTNEI